MTHPVHVPRINNNDDQVKLVSILASAGNSVKQGQALAECESDKATIVIVSEQDGYVLEVLADAGEEIEVGTVLMWIGETSDAQVPQDLGIQQADNVEHPRGQPTAGALALIEKHGLSETDIAVSGSRLKVSDVESYLATRGQTARPVASTVMPVGAPGAEGRSVPLTTYGAAMLNSVSWHATHAVPAYLEVVHDDAAWQSFAKSYRSEHSLLSNPLVPLMAHRLVRIAAANSDLNSTVFNGERYVYRNVNLGFTVHINGKLFLPVIHGAEDMSVDEFVQEFARLHRTAMRGRLQPAEMKGATIALSSMGRWQIHRHIPVLPPFVSLIVAHSASQVGQTILGATYDHRVLDGAAAFEALNTLTAPEKYP